VSGEAMGRLMERDGDEDRNADMARRKLSDRPTGLDLSA
jgi:hypothetical protein